MAARSSCLGLMSPGLRFAAVMAFTSITAGFDCASQALLCPNRAFGTACILCLCSGAVGHQLPQHQHDGTIVIDKAHLYCCDDVLLLYLPRMMC